MNRELKFLAAVLILIINYPEIQASSSQTLPADLKSNFEWFESFSMDVEMDSQFSENGLTVQSGRFLGTFNKDGHRTEWYGFLENYDSDGHLTDNSYFEKRLISENRYLEFSALQQNKPEYAFLSSRWKQRRQNLLNDPQYGAPLHGRLFLMENKTIAEVLSETSTPFLNDELEMINGLSCYVVDAQTKYGRITAWISPENSHTIIKWTNRQIPESAYANGPGWQATYEIKELTQVGNHYIPKVSSFNHEIEDDGNQTSIKFIYRVDGIELSPDFEALNAFSIDIPDGTEIWYEDSPGIKYEWFDGKPRPLVDDRFLDVIENEISHVKSQADLPYTDSELHEDAAACCEGLEDTESSASADGLEEAGQGEASSKAGLVIGLSVAGVLGVAFAGTMIFRRRAHEDV